MKLLYIISGLYNSAGMERVTVKKICYLSKNAEYKVSILTLDQNGRPDFYSLPHNVERYDLGINFFEYNNSPIIIKFLSFLKKQFLFRKKLRLFLKDHPQDIVISLVFKSADFLGYMNDGSKKIIEHHFSRDYSSQFSMAFQRKWFSKFIYEIRGKMEYRQLKKVDKFVVLTKQDASMWGNLQNLCVIPNSIPKVGEMRSTLKNKIVIAVGRLEYQKGFDILLDIWKQVVSKNKDWQLHIYGNGVLNNKLLEQISLLNIADSVKIFPPTTEIYEKIQEASIFALTSRFEGLPMVLLEAMALGVPCVSFKCKCGPLDVINEGIDGFLIEEGDKEGFAVKMRLLMNDDQLRVWMGENAWGNIQRFSEQNIMNTWIKLFNTLQNEK